MGIRPDHKRDASCDLSRETERLLVWFLVFWFRAMSKGRSKFWRPFKLPDSFGDDEPKAVADANSDDSSNSNNRSSSSSSNDEYLNSNLINVLCDYNHYYVYQFNVLINYVHLFSNMSV